MDRILYLGCCFVKYSFDQKEQTLTFIVVDIRSCMEEMYLKYKYNNDTNSVDRIKSRGRVVDIAKAENYYIRDENNTRVLFTEELYLKQFNESEQNLKNELMKLLNRVDK